MRPFTSQEITRIFKTARRVLRHPGLDILITPRAYEAARLLVITPKKVGNAPQRNTIRRRLKAIFHEEKLERHDVDCIVIIKPEGIDLPFQELKTLLMNALAHATKTDR